MMTTSDEGVPANGHQHVTCCHDCPLRRNAIRGWLAGDTPEEWIRMLHGETRMDCHTQIGAQCAGAAIYRRNVAKRCHDPNTLALPADRIKVFAFPQEFIDHHTIKSK
jgi:hypothetical protein